MLDLKLKVASLNARISFVRGDLTVYGHLLNAADPPRVAENSGKTVEHGLNRKVSIAYSVSFESIS
jgi:hypothetical protein